MLIDFVMYAALGIAMGALGGLFGIGGGLIAIPVLGLWFGLIAVAHGLHALRVHRQVAEPGPTHR